MSAEFSTEGAATPDAPAPSLGGAADNAPQTTAAPQTQEAIWERNFAEQPATPTPAEAAPATDQPAPESVTPTTEAQPQTEEGDRLDKLDPVNAKAADFQELRGHRKELERKLKLVEPLAQKAQALGDPQVIDIIAPLFQEYAGDDDPALYQAGKSVVDSLMAYNPATANSLAAGVYEAYKPWMLQEALAEHNITPADLTSFQEWKQSGGTSVRTVYAPVGFPEPDREGYVTIDGIDLNVGKADDPTSGDPAHKAAYSSLKQNWDRDQREKARDAEFTAKETERVNRERQGVIEQRQSNWSNAELRAFEEFVQTMPIKIEGAQEKDQSSATMMVMGVLQHLISEDSDLNKWVDEGRRLAGQGAGKANALAMNARQRSQDHYKQAHKTVTDLFTELTSLRKIVAGGRVQNAPRMPDDSIPVEQGQYNPQPPPPSQAGGNNYQSVFDRNMANLPT